MNSIANSSKLRLMKDYKKIEKEEIDGINACPEENNIYKWDGYIIGPDETPWENGVFKITMEFPVEYPSKPPNIKFISKIFHPNVYNDGRICLDILDKNWSPVYDVCSILISLRSLLTDPNENSPANVEAAQLYKQNIQEYYSRVKKCVEISQIDDENEDVINSQNTNQIENSNHENDNIENQELVNQIHNTNSVNINVNLNDNNDNNDNYSMSNNNLNNDNSHDEDDSDVHSIENVLGTISSHSMTFSNNNNNQNNNDTSSIISNTYSNSNSNSNISTIVNHNYNNNSNVNINNNNDFSSPIQNNSYHGYNNI